MTLNKKEQYEGFKKFYREEILDKAVFFIVMRILFYLILFLVAIDSMVLSKPVEAYEIVYKYRIQIQSGVVILY